MTTQRLAITTFERCHFFASLPVKGFSFFPTGTGGIKTGLGWVGGMRPSDQDRSEGIRQRHTSQAREQFSSVITSAALDRNGSLPERATTSAKPLWRWAAPRARVGQSPSAIASGSQMRNAFGSIKRYNSVSAIARLERRFSSCLTAWVS